MSKKIIYILDCDGVIIDSNQMKVDAMKQSLESFKLFSQNNIDDAINSFKSNFGQSRYWHIDQFLKILKDAPLNFSNDCLERYSKIVKVNYLSAPLCKGVKEFLDRKNSVKYVVSGSDQSELVNVFKKRKIDHYFELILGSPKTKVDNIASIKNFAPDSQFTMIGDSFADLHASIENSIDFIFYKPYSMVSKDLEISTKSFDFRVLNSWRDLI